MKTTKAQAAHPCNGCHEPSDFRAFGDSGDSRDLCKSCATTIADILAQYPDHAHKAAALRDAVAFLKSEIPPEAGEPSES